MQPHTSATTSELDSRNGYSNRNLFRIAVLLLAILAAAPPLFMADNAVVRTLSVSFVSIVLEAMPFLLLGSLVGGIVEVFLSADRLAALLPRRRLPAILASSLLGLILPLCECAVIPVTRRLIRKGMPFAVALAYLIAGPIVNVIVAGSTAAAYFWDWRIVGLRLGSGFIIAVLVGLIVDRVFPGSKALKGSFVRSLKRRDEPEEDCCDNCQVPSSEGKLSKMLRPAVDDFLQVSQFLIVGAFFAALSQTLVERQAMLELAGSPALSIALMMGLAVALNLCSEADAFVAAAYRNVLPLTSQLAFMVLGPMLDLKLAAMYLSFVRKRAFIFIAAAMVVLVFLLMFALERVISEGIL
jgi:hypothetical protein